MCVSQGLGVDMSRWRWGGVGCRAWETAFGVESCLRRFCRSALPHHRARNHQDENKSILMLAGGKLQKVMNVLNPYPEYFDFLRIYSSDVHDVIATFGVEVAYCIFRDDVKGVFGSHNVAVDSRHISLIADYALASGKWKVV